MMDFGEAVSINMNCPSCGAETKKDSSFCVKCGAKIVREPEKARAAAPPPSPAVRQPVAANKPPVVANAALITPKVPEEKGRVIYVNPVIVIAAVFVAIGVVFLAGAAWKHKKSSSQTHTAPLMNYFDCDSGSGISKINWSAKINDVITAPVLYDGLLYYAKNSVIYTVRPETGEIKELMKTWVENIKGLALEDGRLYISSGLKLSVVDLKTKQELWEYATQSDILALYSDVIYLRFYSGEIVAVDAETGKEISRLSTDMDGYFYMSTYGETVFYTVAGQDYYTPNPLALSAVNIRDGKVKWQFQDDCILSNGPYASEDMVFVVCKNKFLAIDIVSGKLIWSNDVWTRAVLSTTKDTIFVGTEKDYVYAFDIKTGTEKWRFGGSEMSFATVSATSKYLYATTQRGMIYVLDADTGYEETRFNLKTSLRTPPLITDRYMIVFGDDLTLYSLPLE